MTKDDIIRDLTENIYCRIQHSPIHGVGVFAIKEIPKGTKPLTTFRDVDVVPIPEKEIMENATIPNAVKDMVKAFYATQDGMIYFSDHSLNEIDISYFLNHSDMPNVDVEEINEESIFIANRDIHIGEELTSNYTTYSDHHIN